MLKCFHNYLKLTLLISLLLVSQIWAAPIAILDHSFEDNTLNSGGWSNSLGPEWQETTVNSGNTFEEYVNGFAIDGTDTLGMESGHTVWQDLGTTYQANKRYTLTVGAGNRQEQTFGGNQSIFRLADDSGTIYATGSTDASNVPVNSFDDFEVTFETSADPTAVGETIRVLLESAGSGRSHFDNIRLEEEDAAPGLATIFNNSALGLTSTGATLNGEVIIPGDSDPEITIFYGLTNGGNLPANWDFSVTLPGTHSGAFSTSVTGLNAGSSYFFAARATNSAGTSWALPSETFQTLAAPPTVANGAVSGLLATSAILGAEVLATGGDNPSLTLFYGTTDGETTEGDWDSSLSLGTVPSATTASITGLSSGLNYFFRVRGSNSGGTSWAASSSAFTTPVVVLPGIENRSPSGVTANTASLRGEVTETGFDDTTVTLYFGTTDGGTTPANWEGSLLVGSEDGNFSRFVTGLSAETTYYYNSSATNSAGTSWPTASESFQTPAALPDQVIINEFHYDADDETSAEEFIELHNPGSNEINIAGWSLTEAVEFQFPPNTTIPAGGYLVVGEDPATLQIVFNVSALGPWDGGLNNDGEKILLLNTLGEEVDQVSYRSGFPWPTAARGDGSSAELMNPSLDNDLGGSWRSSGAETETAEITTFIPEADLSWSYRKGTSPPPDPNGNNVTAWRLSNYVEDSSWLTGQTPIGYGDGDNNTILSDMRSSYSSVFLRQTFTIAANEEIPNQLRLRIYADDGAVVWINGTEVLRFSVPAGQLDFDDLALNNEASWEEFILDSSNLYLVGGTNTIAIHALNTTLQSSDFSVDASLTTVESSSAGSLPTPGAVNTVFTNSAGPQIRQVDHSPNAPSSSDDVVISAKVTDPDGVTGVTLEYQLVEAGSYIRLTDPAYETSWTQLTMLDDGQSNDTANGDFTYTATLPASLHNHRQLVRYRIIAEDGNNVTVQVPYPDDEQPNFAYFVYDGIPGWTGSFTPASADVTFPSSLTGSLPAYHVIANSIDVNNSQYNSGSDGVHQRGTFVYEGHVYDHIEFENRGEGSTYVAGKNKWRIHFNRARRFQGRDNWGNELPSTVTRLNFNTCASPWAVVNRGMAGLDESVTFRLYELAGVPSPRTSYFSLRVIDDAQESPSDQYGSDLWGLYLAIEQPSGKFLDDRDLPDGNVYKIEGGSGDKKEQGDTQVIDSSDWNSFYSASNNTNTEQWWRENMHMSTYYSMRSLNRLLGNVDIRIGFNHYFYHEPTQDQWWPIPWDLDMMYIAETHQAGVIRQQNSLDIPALELEFRNRARELLDLTASDNSVTGGQIGQLIDEYTQIVNPTGLPETWADLDAFMWNEHPRTRSSGSPQTNHRGNFFRTPYTDQRFGGTYVRSLVSSDHEGFVNHILSYTTDNFTGGSWAPGNGVPAGYGYEYLKLEAADNDIPNRPTLTYTGAANYPVNGLTFESGAFTDPDGNGSFGKMRWRAAQIAAPGVAGYLSGEPRIYEVETTFQSEDLTSFTPNYELPASALVPGNTYRVRVQYEDATGRTSHWSEPAEFVVGEPNVDVWADNLMVTEIMYNPPAPNATESLIATDNDDFEFIELTNISETLTLDLSQIAFTDGIDFDFSTASITSLAPGECLVLVKNLAAFEARYGTGLSVAGVYPNSFSNGGEELEISFAANTPVRLFTYDDRSPWPDADGSGFSLVLIDPAAAPDHGDAASWALSDTVGGNPCQPAAGCVTFEDYLAENFEAAQLADPAISGAQADPDGDGLVNFLEYAQGSSPLVANELSSLIFSSLHNEAGEEYLALTYQRLLCQDHLSYLVEVSPDLVSWQFDASAVTELSASDNGDGTETVLVRSNASLSDSPAQFIRLRVKTVPE